MKRYYQYSLPEYFSGKPRIKDYSNLFGDLIACSLLLVGFFRSDSIPVIAAFAIWNHVRLGILLDESGEKCSEQEKLQ